MFKFFEALGSIFGTIVKFVINTIQIIITLFQQIYSASLFMIAVFQSINAPFIVPTLLILFALSVFLFVMHRGA